MLAWLLVLSPIATLIVVMVGIFFSNRHVDVRIADLSREMNNRFADVTARLEAVIKAEVALLRLDIGKLEMRVKALEERAGVIYRA
jgi:hypothetical protein